MKLFTGDKKVLDSSKSISELNEIIDQFIKGEQNVLFVDKNTINKKLLSSKKLNWFSAYPSPLYHISIKLIDNKSNRRLTIKTSGRFMLDIFPLLIVYLNLSFIFGENGIQSKTFSSSDIGWYIFLSLWTIGLVWLLKYLNAKQVKKANYLVERLIYSINKQDDKI